MSWKDMFNEAKRERKEEEKERKKGNKELLREEEEKKKETRKLIRRISDQAKPVLREYAKAMGLSMFSIETEEHFDEWCEVYTARRNTISRRVPDHIKLIVSCMVHYRGSNQTLTERACSISIDSDEVWANGKKIPIDDFTEDWLAEALLS